MRLCMLQPACYRQIQKLQLIWCVLIYNLCGFVELCFRKMGIELSALVQAILLIFAAFVTATEDESDGFKGGENTSGQGDFPSFTLQINK